MREFLRVGIPISHRAKPACVDVKHLQSKLCRIMDHPKGERLIHLHATAPTVVNQQRIFFVLPSFWIIQDLPNPRPKHIPETVLAVAKAPHKNSGGVEGLSG